jgi:ketosteroid isomerase-like protein
MDDRPTGQAFEQACERLNDANTRMLDGDWSVWKELLTARDDVTLLGAYGAYVTGWADVAARFERTAGGYVGGGGQSTSDNIARWVGADLACTVDLERHRARLDGQPEPVTFTYRVTHVFRREEGRWKVVLRHADPLDTFRGPEFAHAAAVAER